MGDGIQRKYAIIINGDTESRHLENVDRAIRALRQEDGDQAKTFEARASSFLGNWVSSKLGLKRQVPYEILVASPQAPHGAVDSYTSANSGNIPSLVNGIKGKIDDDDLLVVYVTGHGDQGKTGEGCAVLQDQCYSLKSLNEEFKKIPSYGNRLFIMDQCYSGNGFPLFANSNTTVISQGAPGETVCCQNFSPYLWADKSKIPDLNGDGIITIQERYAYALRVDHGSVSLAQYFSPQRKSFSLGGLPALKNSFSSSPKDVVEIYDDQALQQELKKLKPGQLALVDFSADWCGPCRKYEPQFKELARKYEGKYLLIHAQGVNGSEEVWKQKYGVQHFPTVAFIDYQGRVAQVDEKHKLDPEQSLLFASMIDKEFQINFYLNQLQSKYPEEQFQAAEKLLGIKYKNLELVANVLMDLLSDQGSMHHLEIINMLGELLVKNKKNEIQLSPSSVSKIINSLTMVGNKTDGIFRGGIQRVSAIVQLDRVSFPTEEPRVRELIVCYRLVHTTSEDEIAENARFFLDHVPESEKQKVLTLFIEKLSNSQLRRNEKSEILEILPYLMKAYDYEPWFNLAFHPDSFVRAYAMKELTTAVKFLPTSISDLLMKKSTDSNPKVRRLAAYLMGTNHHLSSSNRNVYEIFVNRLREMQKDKDQAVRKEAIRSLPKLSAS